jgi:vitamin B12 transporter
VDEGDPGIGNRYEGAALNASLGLELPAGADLRTTLRFARPHMKAFPDDSGGAKYAVRRELEERKIHQLGVGLELSQEPLGWLGYSLSGTYYRHEEDRTSPGIAPGLRDPFGIPAESSDDQLDRFTLAARTTAWFRDQLSLTFGGDTTWEEGSSDSVLAFFGSPTPAGFDLDRFVGGLFAEGAWRCGCGLTVQSGLRLDLPNDASSELTPRVSGSYRVPDSPFVLSASWGEGFKLPSFFALGNPIVGNPELRTEKSRGFDVGVSFEMWQERAKVRVTYFDVSVRNLIDFDAEVGPFGRLVNRTKVISRGVEAGLLLEPLSSLRLSGNVTYTETDIRGTSQDLLNRPRWRGDAAVIWRPIEPLMVRLQALFVGEVLDSSVPTGEVTLDPYQRVDFSTSWRLRERLTLYLAVDNLLDQDYQEAVGFPSIGIRPRAGIALRL